MNARGGVGGGDRELNDGVNHTRLHSVYRDCLWCVPEYLGKSLNNYSINNQETKSNVSWLLYVL
jgi:hypothetical protein